MSAIEHQRLRIEVQGWVATLTPSEPVENMQAAIDGCEKAGIRVLGVEPVPVGPEPRSAVKVWR